MKVRPRYIANRLGASSQGFGGSLTVRTTVVATYRKGLNVCMCNARMRKSHKSSHPNSNMLKVKSKTPSTKTCRAIRRTTWLSTLECDIGQDGDNRDLFP